MKVRIITGFFIALVFAAVILLSIWVHELFFDIFVLLLMLVCSMEVGRAIGKKYAKPMYVLIILSIIAGYTVFYITNAFRKEGGGITAYFGVIAVSFVISIIISIFSKKNSISNVISTIFTLLYPAGLLIYMIGLNYFKDETIRIVSILLIFLVTPLTDTMAYFVGSTLKGPKLAPKISPKKTISGAVGGLIGGILGGALIILFTEVPFFSWLKVSGYLGGTQVSHIIHCLVLGLGGSICTQLGDLIGSYIKRQCGVKDFSNLLPGHGGITDRIDGMTINGIFLFVYMMLLSFNWGAI